MKNDNINNKIYKDEVEIILEKIVKLQKEAVRDELQEKFCDNDCLGDYKCNDEFNTRPIQVFTTEDRPWHCPVEANEDGCDQCGDDQSCVFRAEKVENGAVVLRALKECNEEHGRKKFKSTNSYITVKLAKIAAVRCLKDTFIDICIR